jgi:hypothetical protein
MAGKNYWYIRLTGCVLSVFRRLVTVMPTAYRIPFPQFHRLHKLDSCALLRACCAVQIYTSARLCYPASVLMHGCMIACFNPYLYAMMHIAVLFIYLFIFSLTLASCTFYSRSATLSLVELPAPDPAFHSLSFKISFGRWGMQRYRVACKGR